MDDGGIKVSQLVGMGSAQEWAQVRSLVPLEKELMASTGALFLVIKVTGGIAAENGVAFMEKIYEEQQEAREDELGWLKNKVVEFEQNLEGELLIGLVKSADSADRRVLYLAGTRGKGKVELERGGKLIDLWPMNGSSLSGWLEEGDVLVMGTSRFMAKIWGGEGTVDERLEAAKEKIDEIETAEVGLVIEISDQISDLSSQLSDIRSQISDEVQEIEEQKPETKTAGLFQRRWVMGLRPEENWRKIWAVRIGAAFLALFVMVVGIGMWRRSALSEEKAFNEVVMPIKDALTEAMSIKDVNPVRARSLVLGAKTTAGEETDYVQGKRAGEWRVLVAEVDKIWVEVSGEKAAETKLWLDLAVVKDGLEAEVVALDGEWVTVLDKEKQVVAGVNLGDKTSKLVMAGKDLDGVIDMGSGSVVTVSDIWIFNAEEDEKERALSESEEVAGSLKVRKFANNIYTFDGSEMWKFPATDDGLGGRRRYFGPGVEPDLSEVVDVWIDGEIWLVTRGGKLMRFSRGVPVGFSLKNFEGNWGEVAGVVTDDERGEILIWDKGAGTVVVFDRETGEYKRKLLSEDLKKASGWTIDEEGKRLILGVEGKLMELLLD